MRRGPITRPETRHLVIMVKEPRLGRVKTRLAADIGTVAATWWYRHQTWRLVRALGNDPRWRTQLAVAPDVAVTSRAWPQSMERFAQGSGDLGDRMRSVLRAFPNGPVLIVGSDIPAIKPGHIWDAFAALGRADAVFGPAHDGGYWSVGVARRAVATNLFLNHVRWSGPHALQDSVQSLGQHKRVLFAATLRDVDCLPDLKATQMVSSRRTTGSEALLRQS